MATENFTRGRRTNSSLPGAPARSFPMVLYEHSPLVRPRPLERIRYIDPRIHAASDMPPRPSFVLEIHL